MPRCRFVMEQDLDIVGSGYRHPRVREQEADRTPGAFPLSQAANGMPDTTRLRARGYCCDRHTAA
jgi:hypothetical protein